MAPRTPLHSGGNSWRFCTKANASAFRQWRLRGARARKTVFGLTPLLCGQTASTGALRGVTLNGSSYNDSWSGCTTWFVCEFPNRFASSRLNLGIGVLLFLRPWGRAANEGVYHGAASFGS